MSLVYDVGSGALVNTVLAVEVLRLAGDASTVRSHAA